MEPSAALCVAGDGESSPELELREGKQEKKAIEGGGKKKKHKDPSSVIHG